MQGARQSVEKERRILGVDHEPSGLSRRLVDLHACRLEALVYVCVKLGQRSGRRVADTTLRLFVGVGGSLRQGGDRLVEALRDVPYPFVDRAPDGSHEVVDDPAFRLPHSLYGTSGATRHSASRTAPPVPEAFAGALAICLTGSEGRVYIA